MCRKICTGSFSWDRLTRSRSTHSPGKLQWHGQFISNQAEFTPRNVQTTDSRQTTVYAIKLDLDPSGGMLKPGMPADVHFGGPSQ